MGRGVRALPPSVLEKRGSLCRNHGVRSNGRGGEGVPLETITLKNATIASLKRHVGEVQGLPHAELEEIGLRFETMEVQAKGAKKSVKLDTKNRK